MDTFTLEYRAPWPTSLVLSRGADQVPAPVRHIFHCKRVERRLCAAWRARRARGGGVGGGVRGSGGARGDGAHVVLQRMLHFTQNFVHYLTMEVIDPNWASLEKKLDAAATVDELIAAHDAFLDACLKEGMLFWPTTLRRLDVIAKTCVAFADAVASVGDDEEDTDGFPSPANDADDPSRENYNRSSRPSTSASRSCSSPSTGARTPSPTCRRCARASTSTSTTRTDRGEVLIRVRATFFLRARARAA